MDILRIPEPAPYLGAQVDVDLVEGFALVSIPPGQDRRSTPSRGRRRRGRTTEPSPSPVLDPAATAQRLPSPDLAPLTPQPAAPSPVPPSAARGGQRLGRVRQGLFVFGIRLAAVVVLELVAAAVLLGLDLPFAGAVAVVVVAILVAAAAIMPFRGVRLGTWLVSAAGYVARRHILTAEPVVDAQPAPQPVGAGLAVRSGSASAARVGLAQLGTPTDPETVAVPSEVRALFPGVVVRQAHTRTSGNLGMVQWRGRWTVVVGLSAPGPDLLLTTPPVQIPVERLLSSLNGHGLVLDAVGFVTHSSHGDPHRFGGAALAAVAAELASVGPLVRGRETWITVRIDPVQAAAAIEIRGGGFTGLERLAAAAVSRLTAESEAAGLVARPLDADGAVRALVVSLQQPPVPEGTPLRWIEAWKEISSAQVHHRCFVVHGWRTTGLESIQLSHGCGLTITHETHDVGGAEVRVETVLRVSATTVTALDRASAELRSAARAIGVSVRLLRGRQADAMRMTLPGGQR